MSESHVKELIGQLFYSDTRQVCLVVSSESPLGREARPSARELREQRLYHGPDMAQAAYADWRIALLADDADGQLSFRFRRHSRWRSRRPRAPA